MWFDVDRKPHLGLGYQSLDEVVLAYTASEKGGYDLINDIISSP